MQIFGRSYRSLLLAFSGSTPGLHTGSQSIRSLFTVAIHSFHSLAVLHCSRLDTFSLLFVVELEEAREWWRVQWLARLEALVGI